MSESEPPEEAPSTTPTPGAQTANRAIELLLLAVNSDRPLTLAELGRLAGLNKAATYRLVQPLISHSLIAREPNGRRYGIGGGLIALAATVMQKVRIRELARPIIEEIARSVPETIGLHIRNGNNRVCIDVLEGPQPIRRVLPLGATLPLYAGPTGKAILAFLPEAEISQVVDIAERDGADRDLLLAHIEQLRRDRYLAVVDDRIVGVGGLSVPIFDATGVCGSLTISGPSSRFDVTAMEAAVPIVTPLVARLNTLLGCPDPRAQHVLAGI